MIILLEEKQLFLSLLSQTQLGNVYVFIGRLVYILHNHQSRFLVVNKYVM